MLNRSFSTLHLRLHSIPFTNEKVRLNPGKAVDCVLSCRSSGMSKKDQDDVDKDDKLARRKAAAGTEGSGCVSDDGEQGVPLLMWNQQADLCVAGSAPARNVLYLDFSFDG